MDGRWVMTLLRIKKPGAAQPPHHPGRRRAATRTVRTEQVRQQPARLRPLRSFEIPYHNHEPLETGHVHLVVGGGVGDRKAQDNMWGTSAVPGFSNHTGADQFAGAAATGFGAGGTAGVSRALAPVRRGSLWRRRRGGLRRCGPALARRDATAARTVSARLLASAREGRPALRASAPHAKPGEPRGAAQLASAVPLGPALERRDSTAARTGAARRRPLALAREARPVLREPPLQPAFWPSPWRPSSSGEPLAAALPASARDVRPAMGEPPLQPAFWPSPWRSSSWRLVCVPEIWRPGPSWQAPWRSPSRRLVCVPEIWRPGPSWQAPWRSPSR